MDNKDLSKKNLDKNGSNIASRRKFLIKGAVAAPIISSVLSKSVWANECTISGQLSGNHTSHNDTDPTVCSLIAFSPGSWKDGKCSGKNGYPDLWQYTGCNRRSNISNLLPGCNDNVRISSCLKGYDSKQLKKKYSRDDCEWIQQATCAALNSLLWDKSLAQAKLNTYSPMVSEVDKRFYFPVSLSSIQRTFNSGRKYEQLSAWKSINCL